jgi:hypothetical protein
MSNPVILAKQLARIRAAYASEGRKPVIVPGELRLESALSASSTSFRFFHSVTQAGFNTEIKLDLNDVFFVSEINVQVAAPASATDTAFRLFNYGNSVEFSTANARTSINGLYNNGVLNITKDQVLYLQNWMLKKHYKSPIWQDNLTTGFTTTGATVPNGQDATDGATDGFYPLVPSINFSGRDNLNISINVATSLAAIQANSRLVLTFRGFKAIQAA